MVGKARVQKRLYYKIGEACKALGIQPYVLRYWETEFPALAPSKSRSGQRVYSEKEIDVIRRIKELLYEEGYTIAGAKKKLEIELANGTLGEAAEDREALGEAKPTAVPADPAEAVVVPSDLPAAIPPPAPSRRPPPAAEAASPALDSEAAEQVQRLRSGIEKALQEARELLALLDS